MLNLSQDIYYLLSSMKTSIWTSPAPQLFSLGIVSKSAYTMEISGQIWLKDWIVVESFEDQSKQAFMNVLAVLKENGWGLDNISKVRMYLTDMQDYAQLNEIYTQVFAHITPAPTRVAIWVNELPLGASIELDCTAVGDTHKKNASTINVNASNK